MKRSSGVGDGSKSVCFMMTLHEAIATVLQHGAKSAREIADEINRRGLYRRKDGRDLPASQVSARVSRYRVWFDRNSGLISLK